MLMSMCMCQTPCKGGGIATWSRKPSCRSASACLCIEYQAFLTPHVLLKRFQIAQSLEESSTPRRLGRRVQLRLPLPDLLCERLHALQAPHGFQIVNCITTRACPCKGAQVTWVSPALTRCGG